MTDVISQYQNWKQQGHDLRAKARQAMESRFRELLTEAVKIAEEYRADFGSQLKVQSPVTAFRYKATAKAKTKKTGKPIEKPAPNHSRIEPAVPQTPSPKVAALQKRLVTARQKLEKAKSDSKPFKAFEDRVYEIEDELRLINHA